jgi:murein DD-endopeptidase MepM/ murein hydrolase activator NlpD
VALGITVPVSLHGVSTPAPSTDVTSESAAVLLAARAAATDGAAVRGTARAALRPSYAGAEVRTVLERTRDARRPSRDTGGRRTTTHHGRDRREKTPAPPSWALPVVGYHLTAGFGECSALWSGCHTGLDFAAATGTPIRAVAAGTITEVGWAGAYGNRTIETLEDGTEVWYCHQDSVIVGRDSHVAVGQEIGHIGSTGNVTGPHLHLEVRPGGDDPVDPYAFLASKGVTP